MTIIVLGLVVGSAALALVCLPAMIRKPNQLPLAGRRPAAATIRLHTTTPALYDQDEAL